MRRLHLIFAIVVVTAFVSAFLAERSRPFEPAALPLRLPASAALQPLRVARGEHALRGTVRDHAGRPAPEVTVHARPLADEGGGEPFFFAHTTADGTFALEGMPAGPYALVLVRPGVRNTTSELEVPADGPVTLRLQEPYGDVPAAPDPVYVSVTGSVRRPPALSDGEAELAGLEVLLLPRDDEARWRGAMERRATVDATGRFRIDDLAVADHEIAVVPAWARGGTWPVLVERELSAADVARSAADEGADALELELEVGALEGRLFDARGRPVEGALLRILALGDGPERAWPAASSDAEGRFHLRDLPAPASTPTSASGRLYDVSVYAGAARQSAHVEVRGGELREVRFGPLATRGAAERE